MLERITKLSAGLAKAAWGYDQASCESELQVSEIMFAWFERFLGSPVKGQKQDQGHRDLQIAQKGGSALDPLAVLLAMLWASGNSLKPLSGVLSARGEPGIKAVKAMSC